MADIPNNAAEMFARESIASEVAAASSNMHVRFKTLIQQQHATYLRVPSVGQGGTLVAIHAAADRLRLKISTITDAHSYARGKSERFVDKAIKLLESYCDRIDDGGDALYERAEVIRKIKSIEKSSQFRASQVASPEDTIQPRTLPESHD